jgi:choline dehydrogenase-like flavoprotein
MTNTQLTKVNLKKRNGLYVVTGVTLLSGQVLSASKEVILSAGTIQSPQLLELSGIGSTDILNAAGVKELIDLPGVGENL